VIDGDTKDDRLLEARRLFEEATDFWTSWQTQAEEDINFYHGQQWTREDVTHLTSQRRPVLTYNVLQAKVAHLLGAAEDNSVDPIAIPAGSDDQFLADALNHIRDQVYEHSNVVRVDAQILEDGIVAGIGNAAIDAMPETDDPSRLSISYERAHPLEVLWDPGCESRDKTDARYLCWSKWLTKSEFKSEYPELAGKADDIFSAWSGADDSAWRVAGNDTSIQASPNSDGYLPRRSALYYDAKRREIRVVHIECIKSVKRTVAYSSAGDSREVDPSMKAVLNRDNPGAYTFEDQWTEEVYWYEFTGNQMLYEDASPQPFKGFSIKAFVFKADDDNRPYGIVRLLKDAQREVN